MKKILYAIFLFVILSRLCSAQLAPGWHSKDLYVQRYWKIKDGSLKEKMLLFNKDSLAKNVFVTVSKFVDRGIDQGTMADVCSLGIVGGPWKIPANKYIVVDPPKLIVNDTAGLFFKFSEFKNETTLFCGFLNPYDVPPAVAYDSSIIYLTQVLNGFESRRNFGWWELNSIVQKSGGGTTAKLMLRNIDDPVAPCILKKILIFKFPDSLTHFSTFPRAIITDGFTKDSIYSKEILRHWNSSLQYVLSYTSNYDESDSLGKKLYDLNFKFKMPKVEEPEILVTSIFVDAGSCRQELGLHFIVLP